MMIKSCQNLFEARQLFLSVKSKMKPIPGTSKIDYYFFVLASVTAGYDIAFEVLGRAGANDLLSPKQKNRLATALKKTGGLNSEDIL